MTDEEFMDAVFGVSPAMRYVAVARGQRVTMRERQGLSAGSAAESDRYEELLVNPALLVLTRQRGDIDYGGLRFLLVRFDLKRPLRCRRPRLGWDAAAVGHRPC
jgi:hypothetical protein